jgi:dimethylargininase
MTSDGTHFTRAIVCPPAASFANGITTADLGVPDIQLASAQHAGYCRALEGLGVNVTFLPPDPIHPDSTFVEDTAVVTRHGAIVTHPGAPSRRGEVPAIEAALRQHFGEVARITAPGTLDGGDVCQAGEHFFIGLSGRTNAAGVASLTAWLESQGYVASTIDIRGDSDLLHLKSGLAYLGDKHMVAVSSIAADPSLVGFAVLVVPDDEAYAANCVRVNDAVLMPAGCPALAARVAALGHAVVPVEMSEFRKMDGGPSCLSVRIP